MATYPISIPGGSVWYEYHFWTPENPYIWATNLPTFINEVVTYGGNTTTLATEVAGKVSKAGDTMTGPLLLPAGSNSAPALARSGDTNTGITLPGSDVLGVVTAGTERMRIDATGGVSIGGASNAFHKLCVYENANSTANLLLSTTSLTASPGLGIVRLRPSSGVQSGDVIGTISMTGYDGSTGSGQAIIQAVVDGATATGSVPTRLVFSTTPTGSLAPSARMIITEPGHVSPGADNTQTLGAGSFRWSTVYAGTGTINTSDAREKTDVRQFTAAEMRAAKNLAREIGVYQWLASIAEKGDAARLHIGMTVQRAIELMEAEGLDPWRYGFICCDDIVKRVKVTKTRSVQKTEDVEETYSEIEIIQGVPTQVSKTRTTKQPVFDQVQVVDAKGNPVFREEQRTVERKVKRVQSIQKTEDRVETVTEVQVIDGVPTQVAIKRTVSEPVFEDVPVVDKKGNPVARVEDRPTGVDKLTDPPQPVTEKVEVPVMHRMPVVIETEIEVTEQETITEQVPVMHQMPVMVDEEVEVDEEQPNGDRLGFRYDQLAMFIAAGQEARLAQLEEK